MNANLIAAIIVILVMGVFLFLNRKKISISGWFPFLYVFMFRGKYGLKLMDKLAKKCNKFLKVMGFIGVIIGFLGMAFVCFEIIYNTYLLFFKPAAMAGVQLVLPFEAKGVFYVPFIYWILAIFVVALIHEFSHGVIGRAYKIPLVSTGLAFLALVVPIIPAAFVEPNEKKFAKFNKKAKLQMLAAGPFANILLGFVILLLLVPISPLVSNFYSPDGVEIVRLAEDGPADSVGMIGGSVIKQIDGIDIVSVLDFQNSLGQHKAADVIKIKTDKGTFDVNLQEKNEKAFLGVFIRQKTIIKEGRSPIIAKTVSWIYGLFVWIYLLNLGIGLFNLLPIGPLDGGKMLNLILGGNKGKKVFKVLSFLFFVLIMINIFSGFLK